MYIVIPTHNRNSLLTRTLQSLSVADFPASYQGTYIIENGGRFGAEEVVSRFGSNLRLQYRYCEQGNKSAALNSLLKELAEGLIVFFDDDVRIDVSTLLAYDSATQGKSSGFYGGPVKCDYEVSPKSWIQLPRSVMGWDISDDIPGQELRFLGFNWAAFAEELCEVGQFDGRFGPGGTAGGRGQEYEMQCRLSSRGVHPTYVPDALVWHYVPEDRCSISWSLDRAFQEGVTRGVMIEPTKPLLLGASRWLYRRAGTAWIRALGARISFQQKKWYANTFEWYRFRGIINGMRQQTKAQKK